MSQSETYVYFALYGTDSEPNSDFDPDEVTKKLGINPTRAWRKGDKKTLSGIEYKYAGWIWETNRGTEPIWVDKLVTKVVDAFEYRIDAIVELKRELQLESILGIILYVDMNEENSTPALGQDLRTIKFLYETQTYIDVDIYRYDSSN